MPDLNYEEMLALQVIEANTQTALDQQVVESLILKGLVSLGEGVQLTAEGRRWLTVYRKLGEATD